MNTWQQTKNWNNQQLISAEHGIDLSGSYVGEDDLQLQRIGCYFTEGAEGRWVA